MNPSTALESCSSVESSSGAKRFLALGWIERPVAAAALIGAAPALGLLMGAVRLLSGRPPLVALRRVGRDGEEFWMLKLRTMWETGSGRRSRGVVERIGDAPVPERKARRDPRVTSRFAAFCRKYSLDELPQLIHVVSGAMSLVGPRPLTRGEIDTHYGESATALLSVKPGCTGLWQVLGRNRLTYAQRRRLDLFFVRRKSVRLYLEILWRTPWRVLSGTGAW